MATLDNFHTGNDPRPLHPTLRARHRWIQKGLSSNTTWDPANHTPVAPVAPYNPGARASAHPSAQIEERLTNRAMKDYLVPTQPRTHLRFGDTAGGVQLIENRSPPLTGAGILQCLFGRKRATLPTVSRFHPYLR